MEAFLCRESCSGAEFHAESRVRIVFTTRIGVSSAHAITLELQEMHAVPHRHKAVIDTGYLFQARFPTGAWR